MEIILRPQEIKYFLGQALFEVTNGQIYCMGRSLSKVDGSQHILSSPTSSLLFFENPSHNESANIQIKSLWNGMEKWKLSNAESTIGIDPNAEESFVISPTGDYKFLEVPSSWRLISSALLQGSEPSIPSVLICGPRKVGKSTFGRFLCNTLLNKYPKVAYLDLDCGQTEFTAPGLQSLNIVERSLLGPPIHHTGITTHCQYLGSLNVSEIPRLYLESALHLFKIYNERYKPLGIPLFVNTMGWVTGLGFMILQVLLQSFRPSHIIALKPPQQSQDPPDDKVPDYIWEALYEKSEFKSIHCTPLTPTDPVNVAAIPAATQDFDRSSQNAAELRNLTWLSYFHQRISSSSPPNYHFDIPLGNVKPIIIPWRSVILNLLGSFANFSPQLHSIIGELNHAVVGLCVPSNQNFMFKRVKSLRITISSVDNVSPACIGPAIVRAVDPIAEVFHIMSPISSELLNEKGAFILSYLPGFYYPRNLIIAAHDSLQEVPYLNPTSSYAGSTSKIRKSRSNIKRKRPT